MEWMELGCAKFLTNATRKPNNRALIRCGTTPERLKEI